uniref:OSJNBb0076A22.8 protein n=1 Tax=Oryza sativa subsp. japonica TaxID=39947 RepID=Q7XV77_ORYSJ|nr:OSJNBb0076A22.8 [Oryza sativa Japonica Group]
MLWLAIAFASLELGLITGGAVAECPDTKCGSVDIPYPFSIGPGRCAMPGFELACKNSRPFLGDFEVVNISLQLSQLRVLNKISSFCYNPASKLMEPNTFQSDLDTPFMLSDTGNKFTVIGCRTLAYIADKDNVGKLMSGCVSACRRGDVTSATNGTCSGVGCCQTTIPKGLPYYQVFFDQAFNTSDSIYNATLCSYAVLMDSSDFKFSTSYLTSPEFNTSYGGRAPMLLDWAIRTVNNCDEAQKNLTLYACKSDKSECFNSSNGPGYICNCTNGYQGNPYRQDGCQVETGLDGRGSNRVKTGLDGRRNRAAPQHFFDSPSDFDDDSHKNICGETIKEYIGDRDLEYNTNDVIDAVVGDAVVAVVEDAVDVVDEASCRLIYQRTRGVHLCGRVGSGKLMKTTDDVESAKTIVLESSAA